MIGALALSQAPLTSHAADHLDSPAVATNPMADVADLYTWMTTDAKTINLALTMSPADDGTRSFGPSVLYAFHLTSRPGFNEAGTESKVICKFASNTSGECWVVSPSGDTLDYVKGDFSATAGVASTSGKLRVFAGQRSDPFFFNLAGFLTAQNSVEKACGGGTTPAACPGVFAPPPMGAGDAAGCPPIPDATALRDQLKTMPTSMVGPCPPNQVDCFANFNVMAIVLQVDKTLVTAGSNKFVTVWASTHTGS